LVAIELQREKVQELERQARQRKLDDAARRLDLQSRKPQGLEPRARQRRPDDATTPLERQKEKFTVRTLEERFREREQQRKHDEAAIKRIEQRKVAEQLGAARREKSSLDSYPNVERDWELWRLEDKARRLKQRDQKTLRDRAGIRAEGAHKLPLATQQAAGPGAKRRPVASQQPAGPYAKRRLVGVEARYGYLF
jgi:hypothetical protein